jgi:hypothetical protein
MYQLAISHLMLFLLSCWLPVAEINRNVTVIIEPGSYLKINGSTNVNHFSCSYTGEIGQDTMNVGAIQKSNGTITLDRAILNVEVDRFDCGNQVMNKDFRSLLEYEEHPMLRLHILSIAMPEKGQDQHTAMAKVRFTIAGENETYQLPVRLMGEQKANIYRGEKVLDITDFRLTPPRKFLGMIVVDEEVVIDFQLNLRLI